MRVSSFKFEVSGGRQVCDEVRLSTGDVRAFTLLEIMVVVVIIGMVAVMGVPAIYSGLKQEGMRKAVNAVVEACNHARAQAIMSGTPVELVFHPHAARLDTGAAADASGAPVDTVVRGGGGGSVKGFSAEWPASVTLEMLDVNLTEHKDDEAASVRFFPNGTCDEMTVIFHSMKNNEWRKISTEIVTGLTKVESVR
jgi:prepilin-type N-terminal cleavage/methylation domain-containing protein